MNNFDVQSSACACGNEFTKRKNLYAHLRRVHKIEPLESKQPVDNKNKLKCNSCDKLFSSQTTLLRHNRQMHNARRARARKVRIICPHDTCHEEFMNYEKLREHLWQQHSVNVECEDLTFKTNADFEQWKDLVQQKTLSLYTKDNSKKILKSGVMRMYYNCHRSYCYKNKGKNIRAMKSIGTNKTGKACPSRLEVTSTSNSRESSVSVKYWKTHCGHTKEIERIPLNRDIRLKIAGKLKEGVSFDRILDSIRDSEVNDDILPRVLLLDRRDIHNIARDFNIPTFNSSRVIKDNIHETEDNIHETEDNIHETEDNIHETEDLMGMKRFNVDTNSKNNVNLVNKTELILGLLKTVSLSDEDYLAIEKQLDTMIETLNKAKLINLDTK